MTTFTVKNEAGLCAAVEHLMRRDRPFTVTVVDGEKRTLAQNRLLNQWYADIAKGTGNETGYIRAYCKLHFGVAILREREDFRAAWDQKFREMSYEEKMAIMSPPWELPVSSIMTVDEESRYMMAIEKFAAEQGVRLESR